MRHASNLQLCAVLGAVFCFFAASVCRGEGTLAVLPDTAQAVGIVGGRVANLRDPSAMHVSPANILYAQEAEFMMNVSVWNGGVDLHSGLGGDLSTLSPWKQVGSMYLLLPIKPGKVVFGIGMHAPYGLDSEFPRTGPYQYVVGFESKLLTLDVTPTLAVKLTDTLSFGMGMEIMYSRLQLKQIFPWGALGFGPFPDGEIGFDADGWGVGGYAGLTWQPHEKHRFSLVGRLPLRVKYEGEFTTRGMPAVAQGFGFQERSDFESDIKYPPQVLLGYGVDLTKRLTMGFDFIWTGNSSHDDVPLLIGPNQPLLGGSTGVATDWRDSFDAGFGASYALSERWALRMGYVWAKNSQKDANYTPAVPSGNKHVMALGLGWRGKKNTVDLAYSYTVFPERQVNGALNPMFNGLYNNNWHVVSLSWTRRF